MTVPFIYQVPAVGQQPAFREAREPVIRDARNPSIYVIRSPSIANSQNVRNQDYRVPHERVTQQPYDNQVSIQNPSIRSDRLPTSYRASVNYANPFIRSKQSPFIAQQPRVDQTSVVRDARQPATYNHRSPSEYQHRSPFEYQHRSPISYQHRSPDTYQHRSPFTYRNPSSSRQPNVASLQQPYAFQQTYQTPYGFRSPFVYQQPYITTRPIQQVAKVKGVFLKQAQGVTKVEKAFVKKDSSTVEKIHQSVPTAQFSD